MFRKDVTKARQTLQQASGVLPDNHADVVSSKALLLKCLRDAADQSDSDNVRRLLSAFSPLETHVDVIFARSFLAKRLAEEKAAIAREKAVKIENAVALLKEALTAQDVLRVESCLLAANDVGIANNAPALDEARAWLNIRRETAALEAAESAAIAHAFAGARAAFVNLDLRAFEILLRESPQLVDQREADELQCLVHIIAGISPNLLAKVDIDICDTDGGSRAHSKTSQHAAGWGEGGAPATNPAASAMGGRASGASSEAIAPPPPSNFASKAVMLVRAASDRCSEIPAEKKLWRYFDHSRTLNWLSKPIFRKDGLTPLHVASANGNVELVKLLILYGASPFIRDGSSSKFTPLHSAARLNRAAAAQALVDSIPDVDTKRALLDCKGSNERTALLYSCEFGHVETAIKLLELGYQFGAVIDARNGDKKNVVDLAGEMKNSYPEGGAKILEKANELQRKRTFHQKKEGCLSTWAESRRLDPVRGLRLDVYNMFSTKADSLRYVLDSSLHEPRSRPSRETLQRVSNFDVFRDRQVFLENSNGIRDDLYLALSYASIARSGVVSADDVEEALFRYEDALLSLPDPKPVDPLYLLAHARLSQIGATSSKSDLLPMLLLKVFQSTPRSADMLSKLDLKSIEELDDWSKKGLEEEVPVATVQPLTVEQEWEKMVKDFAISEENSLAMNKLMRLTGLETVKRQAIAVFSSVFADKKLRENSPLGAKVDCSSVLNFAFMGNPGKSNPT